MTKIHELKETKRVLIALGKLKRNKQLKTYDFIKRGIAICGYISGGFVLFSLLLCDLLGIFVWGLIFIFNLSTYNDVSVLIEREKLRFFKYKTIIGAKK